MKGRRGARVVRVAGLCATPEPWNKEANLATLERLARRAASDGAQLIATSEGFLEGYLWNDDDPQTFTAEEYREVAEPIDGPMVQRVAALASELSVLFFLGFAERRGDRLYNSVAILGSSGALVGRYAKCHTAGDEPFNSPGDELPVFDTELGSIGGLICMDRQLPEAMRVLVLKGAQLIVVPAWGMSGDINDVMMRTRAYENGVWILFVHPRRGLVIDPGGTIVAQSGDPKRPGARSALGRPPDEAVVLATVTLADFRPFSPIRRRRPELYRELASPVVEPTEGPQGPQGESGCCFR